MDRDMSLFTFEQLHSTLNHRKTKALFLETCGPDHEPIMTLGRKEKKGLVCLRDLFVEHVARDPSEFEFGEYVFGDYAFWHNLSQATWMRPYLEEWRMVADVKRKSLAFNTLVNEAENDGRNAYGAAKFLIEEPWKKDKTKKAQETKRKTTETAADEYKEDAIRLKDYF